jgi:DNA/RNA endonuclease G (NUC1)/uncharacterized protein YjdB
MMRRFVLSTLGLSAAALLMVSCSEVASDPAALSRDRNPEIKAVTVHSAVEWNGPPVLISQVYGGGGLSGATYTSDFVELHNPGTAPVDIGNWSIQYASATGTSWNAKTIPEGTTIEGGHYFLIKLKSGSNGIALPDADFTPTAIDMAGASGKVVLSKSPAALGAIACPSGADVVDRIGYGAKANCSSEWGSTADLSIVTSAQRNDAGCAYSATAGSGQFTVETPLARNSASAPITCDGGDPGGDPTPGDPATVTLTPSIVTIEIAMRQPFTASAFDAGGAKVNSDYTWSSTDETVATVDANGIATAVGVGTTTITATSANNIPGTATLIVAAAPSTPNVTISQIYGGGGNTDAPFKNDFVELFNRGQTAVDIGGWSVQYASNSGSSWSVTEIPDGVTLQPGQYYLVQEAAGDKAAAALPAPDAVGTITMSGTVGKIGLSRTKAELSGVCPIDPNVVDRVNYGAAACETIWTRTPAPSNTEAILRADAGCSYTTAAADFEATDPLPRNTASARHLCDVPPGPPASVAVTPSTLTLQATATQTLTASALDANGQAATTTFTWSSDAPAVATVDAATGLVSAIATGTATITATSANGVSGSAALTVTAAPPPASGITITEILADADGDDTKGEWFEVFNAGDAAVDMQGWEIRSGRSSGDAEVFGISASVIVPAGGFAVIGNNANTATNGNINVAYVFPSDVITLSNGSTTEWLALHDGAGATVDSIAYSPRNASGTVIDPTYLPTAAVAREVIDLSIDNTVVSGGNWRDATITFGSNGSKGTPGYGAYGVAGPIASIVISPSPASVLVDGTRTMSALALDALGRISAEPLTWSSSDPSIASIDASGVATGHTPGSVTISATATSGVQSSITLVVVDPNAPATITLTIDSGILPAGSERRLLISVKAFDGHSISAPLTFSFSDSSVLKINNYDGRLYVSGISAGTAEIRATAANGAFGTRTQTIAPRDVPTTAVYRSHVEFGTPTDADPNDDILVTHPEYVSSFNNLRGGPNWVSWNLNATHFGDAPRCNCFSPDVSLPVNAYRVNDADYVNGGYDRGHMVQSESRTATTQENAATFYMTNILPQAAANNQEVWLAFENFLDDLARDQGKEIYIVAGGEYAANAPTLKGEGKVAIPDYTWKIAVVMPGGQGLTNVTSRESMQVYAVRMPNRVETGLPQSAIGGTDWQQYQTTVDAIEAATHYDFLSALPDNIERPVESDDHPPVAAITGTYSGVEGAAIAFTGTATDSDANDVMQYSWSFGDGASATGAAPTHTYSDNGTYQVTLVVEDAFGLADTVTTAVIVTNAAPVVAAFSGATILAGETFTASGSFTDAGADTWSAVVSYGGSVAALPLSGTTFALSNMFTTAGTYDVTVTVTDDDGDTGTGSATVVVQTAGEGAASLSGTISTMETSGDVPAATAATLTKTLESASTSLATHDNASGVNKMNAFKNQVAAALKAGKISSSVAESLNAAADRIIASATHS